MRAVLQPQKFSFLLTYIAVNILQTPFFEKLSELFCRVILAQHVIQLGCTVEGTSYSLVPTFLL